LFEFERDTERARRKNREKNLLDLRVALANYFERIMTERREPIGATASTLFRDLAEEFKPTPEFSHLLHSLRTLERIPALKNKITGQDRIVLEVHFRRSGLYLDRCCVLRYRAADNVLYHSRFWLASEQKVTTVMKL
jgi:hypothetical protein